MMNNGVHKLETGFTLTEKSEKMSIIFENEEFMNL